MSSPVELVLCRVALLAFHLAITDRNSSPTVIATAALSMHYADDKRRAADRAKRIHLKAGRQRSADDGNTETSLLAESLLEEAALLLEHSKSFLNRMMDSAEITRVVTALTGVELDDSVGLSSMLFVPSLIAFLSNS